MPAPELRSLGPALEQGAAVLGVALSPPQVERLLEYLELLGKWGRVYNLSALHEPQQMLSHHLLDSLALVAPLRRHLAQRGLADASLLDVGAGAGLPGVVVALCCPEVRVCCVDAVGKKAAFVQQVALSLKLTGLRGVHARVADLEQRFDIVTARAFASLADFTRCSDRALAPGGVWVAMKGRPPDDELAALPRAVEVFHVEQLLVPGLDAQRCLVWMRRRAAV